MDVPVAKRGRYFESAFSAFLIKVRDVFGSLHISTMEVSAKTVNRSTRYFDKKFRYRWLKGI